MRYERGEVKPLCLGAGSQLLTAWKRPVYPEKKQVAQVSPVPGHQNQTPPSPSVLTMPTGRFCLDPAGCCTEGSRLNPAPTKVTDKRHVDFSGTK